MNRVKWFGLFWCILPYLAYPSDATGLTRCKGRPSASHVEEMDCRNRNYKFIPSEISYIDIKRIYLSRNPFLCDCGMLWFLKLLHGKSLKVKIADLNHVTCAKPNHLKGKLVKDLKKDDVCGGEVLPCQGLNCSKYAKCVAGDSAGRDQCACRTGYLGNGTFCQDLDECLLGTHNCDVSQECRNTKGSFECRCKSGLKTNSQGHCDVPDPCVMLFQPCQINTEVCLDKQRGYECVCKSGFQKKSGTNDCIDVNECKQRNICSKEAYCINKIGSYHCICRPGYTGNGKNCEDIDECETGQHECPDEAVCVNSNGGFQCICKPGYHKSQDGTARCVKNEEEKSTNINMKFIIFGGVGAVILVLSTCCCCWCCRRKSKKERKRSKEKLIGDKAAKANQDLMNLAMETDPFLLQQQQVEQQMFMLGMQQPPPPPFMPFYDDVGEMTMPTKGIRPNEFAMTTWSDDDTYAEASEYYD